MRRSPRTLLRGAAAAALLATAGFGLHVRRNMGARLAVLRRSALTSPHARDGAFANREPGLPRPDLTARQVATMILRRRERGSPPAPVPLAVEPVTSGRAGLAATWFGHTTVLLEIDGRRVLADPVWSTRTSPVPGFGPRRLHPPPVALDALGEVDVVLVSHDHYDHLDRPAVVALARRTAATFVVPLGVGAHLRAWGVAAGRIVERDWDGVATVAGLTFTCLEARHFSGRGFRRNTTQWAAWKVAGPAHAVYVAGDTGASAVHARTGAEHGPFDLTLMPVGAYAELWPDIHTTPEEAVAAHLALRGAVLLPVHWATFALGFHSWADPAERTLHAAAAHGVRLALPRPGQRLEIRPEGSSGSPWWREIAPATDDPVPGGVAASV